MLKINRLKEFYRKNKKAFMSISITLFTFLFLVVGATYAYFAGVIGGGANSTIGANTGTTDSLMFETGDAIHLHAGMDNFLEGDKDQIGTTSVTAKLKANNTTNEASMKYNVFLVIEDNDFEYTTEDFQTEILLKVTDPKGNPAEDVKGIKEVAEGFDITTRSGVFLIAKDYVIETTTGEEEQTWNIEVRLINLDADQNKNKGKTLNGYIYITTDDISVYEIAQINSIEPTITKDSIGADLNISQGSSEIDKYYYGIEEKQSGIAMNRNSMKQMSNVLASKDTVKFTESTSANYKFENLKDNTTYIIYSYAIDKKGIRSNIYETEITTAMYKLPTVTAKIVATHDTITINATATNGDGNVVKYLYSKDGGKTWIEDGVGHIFTGLNSITDYQIRVKVVDENNRVSTVYSEKVTTEEFNTTLANYVKSLFISQGSNNLYYHDESLENGAEDGSYRYAGASNSVNNYVCFGSDEVPCPDDNLYRIIGIFADQIKLIKETRATSSLLGSDGAYSSSIFYYWDRASDYNNTWSHSLLNTVNLNINYIQNIGTTWAEKIATTTWQVGGMDWSTTNTVKQFYDLEVGANKINTTYDAKIGLMYVSDYGYALPPDYWTIAMNSHFYDLRKENWMYKSQSDWTISPVLGSSNSAFFIYSVGYIKFSNVKEILSVRPVFYLNSTEKLVSGTGTSTDPYRIS